MELEMKNDKISFHWKMNSMNTGELSINALTDVYEWANWCKAIEILLEARIVFCWYPFSCSIVNENVLKNQKKEITQFFISQKNIRDRYVMWQQFNGKTFI